MSRPINSTKLTDTLTLSECRDGFWLYDSTRGMNLAMRAKTAQDALVEAITYYQNRLSKVESDHRVMSGKVYDFVSQFSEDEDTDD